MPYEQGFTIISRKVNHVVLQRNDNYRNFTVPMHKELKPGILRIIIRKAGLTVDEFSHLT
ncbi:MAG: type II toxin-antitoxin system HicA family toxin [Candidatus Thermoplasmatota archaeon]|nr:type II toxin-antitoxin system HicA family toxin [Candidatus Thermoplasmatota archaeon]